MAMSDYAEAFFKHEENKGFRKPPTGTRDFHVCQVAIETGSSANNRPNYHVKSKIGTFGSTENSRARKIKLNLLHCALLVVNRTKRCLNCLSLEHFVRECSRPNKCRKCGPRSNVSKRATALRSYWPFIHVVANGAGGA